MRYCMKKCICLVNIKLAKNLEEQKKNGHTLVQRAEYAKLKGTA